MQAVLTLLLILFTNDPKTNQEVIEKYKKPFPQFRLKMEEVDQRSDKINEPVVESSDDFVSFIIDNVKELFVPSDNSTIINRHEEGTFDSASLLDIFRTLTDATPSKMSQANNSLLYNNNLLPFLTVKNEGDNFKSNSSNDIDNELLHSIKKLELTTLKTEEDNMFSITRTCIACNNILNEHCSNPKSKLVPSINCQREDDLCYSQHTPFGIIDRGCFNVNHDLTLFVCACNLCNYMSISEMPYIFANKRDWIENVIELSRAKRFRESIFKDMACLKCEVNVTAKRGNIVSDANCLDGNIVALPSQICKADEICGVKVVRSQGYVWRGCVTEPMYNYWWTICDNDLCNYDAIVSIYDTIN